MQQIGDAADGDAGHAVTSGAFLTLVDGFALDERRGVDCGDGDAGAGGGQGALQNGVRLEPKHPNDHGGQDDHARADRDGAQAGVFHLLHFFSRNNTVLFYRAAPHFLRDGAGNEFGPHSHWE